jgi:23S rRNA G2069 N7-methylase RlmK/C1962 C5-methylase RlmI
LTIARSDSTSKVHERKQAETVSPASAAADAHRRVRLLERCGAAPDHPVVLNLPETEYLKCLVLEVE